MRVANCYGLKPIGETPGYRLIFASNFLSFQRGVSVTAEL